MINLIFYFACVIMWKWRLLISLVQYIYFFMRAVYQYVYMYVYDQNVGHTHSLKWKVPKAIVCTHLIDYGNNRVILKYFDQAQSIQRPTRVEMNILHQISI